MLKFDPTTNKIKRLVDNAQNETRLSFEGAQSKWRVLWRLLRNDNNDALSCQTLYFLLREYQWTP